jgi:hypothetical protein
MSVKIELFGRTSPRTSLKMSENVEMLVLVSENLKRLKKLNLQVGNHLAPASEVARGLTLPFYNWQTMPFLKW